MSTWQFLIDLGSGWIDLTDYDGNGLSLVTRDGIALERQLHNGGRSVIDRLQFELARAPASLLRDLYQQPTYELVPIRVDRDGARWFTGYLRPIDTYDGEPAAGALERVVQLEAVDVLWKLQRTLATAYDQNEQTVDAIVRDLLQRAGFSASDFAFSTTLTQTVANIRERPDDREILEILDDLLFEYHHVMVATEDGKIDLFDWLDDGATPVATLQETIGAESHEKTDEDYGYVVASYLRYDKIESIRDYINVHRSIPDSLRDLAGGDTATARLDLSERVPDGAVVVGAENLEIWLQLYNTTTDARYWAPVRPSRFPVDGVERTGTFTRSGTLALKMDVTASLDAADEAIDLELTLYPDLYESDAALAETWGPLPYDIDLIAVSVYGTILYQQVAGEVREETSAAGESTARREKYEAKYVFDRADAQALAAAILQLRQYGSREWRRRSTSYLPLGSVVTVESATLDLSSRGRIVRLIDAQQNATDDGLQEYAYIIENLDTATSTDNSAPESVPSAPAFPPSAGEIADRPTFGDIAGGVGVTGPLDDLPAPALSATATTRKVSLSVGYSREIVGGSVRCELQISDDGTSWFSLGPGGNGPDDWKGLADEVTQIVGTSYIHDQLPLGGTAADPLTTTYYYRARIVASSLVSEWSAAVTVDVSPVLEGDIGANSVTANKINVADLFSEQITIGAGGYIKSANNAWRIDENSAEFAGWSVAPGVLMSPTGVVEISAENARFQVNDAFGVAKVVSGYLAGLPECSPRARG